MKLNTKLPCFPTKFPSLKGLILPGLALFTVVATSLPATVSARSSTDTICIPLEEG